ncbi:NAD(P)/FAD-dependent oxidoreductase [Futiania mangrovi]|uniref:Thioredoxin reductase n=1 Tax=Futiania mangrovi TaxID=2959716 RepID=A0A9J6PCV3_9PROT|nr:NAD(P)/FAD-dependent oxidoreductase [Futiania mangrovii]MCP1335491.1 NAD(P)/FAD-dependent oxidoreductase [Futiania mangrovii]
MSNRFDIAVIGGGIAGLTAAHHAALGGGSVVHVRGEDFPGGLVSNVGRIEGFPSGGRDVSGADLALGIAEANKALGVEELAENATAVAKAGRGFSIETGQGTIRAGQVIAATGARLKTLDVPGAAALEGKGVSQCAWCDGALNRGRDVVVLGAGDAALEAALYLAPLARKVTVVTHGEGVRGRQAYVTRLADHENVDFRWACEVTEIVGGNGVEAVRLSDTDTGETEDLPCYGVFVFIGQVPNSGLFAGLAECDGEGRILTDTSMETACEGLFAAGAVRAGYGGRLVHAVGEAATAAMAAAARCDD